MINTSMRILFIVYLVLTVSCGTTKNYIPSTPIEVLKVEFSDPSIWNGSEILIDQTCIASGVPETPSLYISKIPSGTNAIIMEYSDESFWYMNKGGHGKIGYKLPEGTTKVRIPPINSNSNKLPEGFWIVSNHKNISAKSGAYMPPCSGGKGHIYSVLVKAVYHSSSDKEISRIFGERKLVLGKY